MAKGKYYAVKKGKKPGIYKTWSECEAQVKGFSGAVYKSFKTMEDAEFFMKDENRYKQAGEPQKPLIAYVDGSYNIKSEKYGFGCVLIEGQTVVKELTGCGNDKDYVGMRNVAGEICGSLCAMDYAARNGYDYLCIYYDYMGIEKWATGEWKTNKTGTKRYKQMVNQYSRVLGIDFMKVAAHTGDYFNERADRLAKESVGII